MNPTHHELARNILTRGTGGVFVIAFLSFLTQYEGLIGREGILPAEQFLSLVYSRVGVERYWLFPTLAWLTPANWFLAVQALLGIIAGVFALADFRPALSLLLCWFLYLSLSVVGQDFFFFQWDLLLLETGLLVAVLNGTTRGRLAPNTVGVWLLRLLLFKLFFFSGIVKLTSGDETWRNATALLYHFETQPLPTWLAWYAYWLKDGVLQAMTVLVLVIELLVPFLIFGPGKARLTAFFTFLTLQTAILLTGNFTFFNTLTIVLCFSLLSDRQLYRWLPESLAQHWSTDGEPRENSRTALTVGAVWLVLSLLHFAGVASGGVLPGWADTTVRWVAPFRSVNGYGLFAKMTTHRNEIIIEGSEDGMLWKAYEFPYKPGDPLRRPAFVAPHQPRLDWQMWFAALGTARKNSWFLRLQERLLSGAPPVLALLETNPFPNRPPRYIRGVLYNYQFTTWDERKQTGAWWKRRALMSYTPDLTLDDFASR